MLSERVDGPDGVDIFVSTGEGGAFEAIVAGGGEDETSFGGGVVDSVLDEPAVAVGAEGDVDELGSGIGGGDDALGEEERGRGAGFVGDADGNEVSGGSDSAEVGVIARDEGGDGGGVAVGNSSFGEFGDINMEDFAIKSEVGHDAGVDNRNFDPAAPFGIILGDAEEGEGTGSETDNPVLGVWLVREGRNEDGVVEFEVVGIEAEAIEVGFVGEAESDGAKLVELAEVTDAGAVQ